MRIKKRIGDILVEAKLVSQFQVSIAAGRAKNFRTKIGQELVKLGFLNEDDLAFTLEQQLGIRWVSLKDINIPPEVLGVMAQEFVEKFFIIPIAVDNRSITIATTEPTDYKTLDTMRFMLNKNIIPLIATHSDIGWAIEKYYKGAVEPIVVERVPERKSKSKFGFEYKVNMLHVQDLMEALLDILIEKGVINKEDLYKRLEKK